MLVMTHNDFVDGPYLMFDSVYRYSPTECFVCQAKLPLVAPFDLSDD